jgi:hypothetical protein
MYLESRNNFQILCEGKRGHRFTASSKSILNKIAGEGMLAGEVGLFVEIILLVEMLSVVELFPVVGYVSLT